jgi:hypothetical protein
MTVDDWASLGLMIALLLTGGALTVGLLLLYIAVMGFNNERD